MNTIKGILFLLFIMFLIVYTFESAKLFYFGSCQEIKEFRLPTYVPNRCIK